MSMGQILLAAGIALVVAAVLLSIIGSAVLHGRKKKVLQEIRREYR